MLKIVLTGLGFWMFLGAAADAQTMHCTTQTRTDRLVPEQIDFELSTRGTSVDVKDSTGEKFGRSWVSGSVTLQNVKRTSMTWTHEGIPQQKNWWGAGKIVIRLNVLANGTFNMTVEPTRANQRYTRFEGRGRCTALQ